MNPVRNLHFKSFSLYIPGIVALVLLLAGFLIVHAFTSPTQAPPGGNVPAPLNAGAASQTKEGNLALNTSNLFLNGLLVPFGNVGIGTTAPGAKLELVGDGVANLGIVLKKQAIDTGVEIRGEQNNMGLRTSGFERMRIDFTGNVGIGTTSPGQKLTVAGVIESTSGGIKFPDATIQTTAAGSGGSLWSASETNIFNTNNGNVGIGTKSPSPEAKLDVAGNIKVGGNIITPLTFAIGKDATASGQNALAIGGTYSGSKLNRATGTGTTAVGPGAEALASGASAFGLNSVASGQDSIVIGDGARASATNSIAFGALAEASGPSAIAIGRGSKATHDNSIALLGQTTKPNQFVIGGSGFNLLVNTLMNGDLSVTGNLIVSGQSVCLADGKNCPAAGAETDPTVLASVKDGVGWGEILGLPSITQALNMNSQNITNVNKLTVNVIDPVYEIGGKKYATYVADVAGGVKTEVTGTINVKRQYVIDFDEQKVGSDLWLFWQTSTKNINDITVLLTPAFDGKAWYEKKPTKNQIIISASQNGEVSFRLTAPRKDAAEWPNEINE